jgi:hypothetical protein
MDYRLAWRRVIPLTYLTSEALSNVLSGAKSAGMPVERVAQARSLSMVKGASRTAFLISRESA